MLKGGHTKFWGIFYAVAQSFSHSEGGGGGVQNLALPVINDQSVSVAFNVPTLSRIDTSGGGMNVGALFH